MRLCVGVGHSANLFELLDTVLEWRYQAQGCAMVGRQRLAVHLVGKQGLRMYRDFALDGNIIPAVRRLEADVLRNTTCLFPRIKLIVAAVEWRECGAGEARARPTPAHNLRPTPHPLKIGRPHSTRSPVHFHPRE